MNHQKITKDWIIAYRELLKAYDRLVSLETEYEALNVGGTITDSDTTPLGFTPGNYTASVADWQVIRAVVEANDAFIREVARGES